MLFGLSCLLSAVLGFLSGLLLGLEFLFLYEPFFGLLLELGLVGFGPLALGGSCQLGCVQDLGLGLQVCLSDLFSLFLDLVSLLLLL